MIENFDNNYTSYSDIQSLRRSGPQSLSHYGQCGDQGQHPGKFQKFQGQFPQQHGQFPQHQGLFPQGQYPHPGQFQHNFYRNIWCRSYL